VNDKKTNKKSKQKEGTNKKRKKESPGVHRRRRVSFANDSPIVVRKDDSESDRARVIFSPNGRNVRILFSQARRPNRKLGGRIVPIEPAGLRGTISRIPRDIESPSSVEKRSRFENVRAYVFARFCVTCARETGTKLTRGKTAKIGAAAGVRSATTNSAVLNFRIYDLHCPERVHDEGCRPRALAIAVNDAGSLNQYSRVRS